MKHDNNWEVVQNGTDVIQRFKVPNGWLYRTFMWDREKDDIDEQTIRVTFVPETKPAPVG